MTQFNVTQRIREELDKVLSLDPSSYGLKRLQRFKATDSEESKLITLAELTLLSEILRNECKSSGGVGPFVHELLEGAEVIQPKKLEEMVIPMQVC